MSDLMRRDPEAKELYERLAGICGITLPAGSVWALCRIAKDGAVAGADLADRAVLGDVLRPDRGAAPREA